ncbi:MAG TPA: anti-sigma regulatory factor [Clostridiales bacterium]|nr:anti-sigma regulatory factor [Clostridiales bacterium]
MKDYIHLSYDIDREDFTRAGEAASDVKKTLKKMNVRPDVVRKVAISLYEGEINMVIHSYGGTINVYIMSDKILMELEDLGPGIEDIDKAMQEGYSTAPESVRSLGFGAGMGLPNMKKYVDKLDIESELDSGTLVKMMVSL